jgi:dihydrofolate reductase
MRSVVDGNMGDFDTMLFGRKTYDIFESFWPTAVSDAPTAPDPHAPERRSEAIRKMGVFINEGQKIVFSRTRKTVTWKNSRLFHELEPRTIESLKKQSGKDMIIFGSVQVATELIRHGLIDELQLLVSPVLVGSRRPVFGDLERYQKLELLEAKPYPSGVVSLRYARKS